MSSEVGGLKPSAYFIDDHISIDGYMSLHPWHHPTLKSFTPAFIQEAPVNKEVEAKANALVKADALAALLPYPMTVVKSDEDGYQRVEAYCPKCETVFRQPSFSHETESRPEFLEWVCPCGYILRTKTKDAE